MNETPAVSTFGRSAIRAGRLERLLVVRFGAFGEIQRVTGRRVPYALSCSQQAAVRWVHERGPTPTWFCQTDPAGRHLLRRAGVPEQMICDIADLPGVPDEHAARWWLRFADETPPSLTHLAPQLLPHADSRAHLPMRSMYRPLVCLVLQGAKLMTVGREQRLFREGQSVILGVDAPVIGRIVEASRDKPYLALAVELDMTVMLSVALEIGTTDAPGRSETTLFVETLDDTILNCAVRLMRLIDHPEAIPVVHPAVLRELHYWLLTSPDGPNL